MAKSRKSRKASPEPKPFNIEVQPLGDEQKDARASLAYWAHEQDRAVRAVVAIRKGNIHWVRCGDARHGLFDLQNKDGGSTIIEYDNNVTQITSIDDWCDEWERDCCEPPTADCLWTMGVVRALRVYRHKLRKQPKAAA